MQFHWRHSEAYRLLSYACAAAFIVMISFSIIDAKTLGSTVLLWDVVHVVVIGLTGIWLIKKRNNPPSIRSLDAIFFFVFLFFPFNIGLSEITALDLGQIRHPFVPFQLLIMYVAFFAPSSLWLATLEIFLTMITATVLWFQIENNYPFSGILLAEPWMTIIYGVVGLLLLWGRAYRRNMLNEFAKTKAEAEAFERASNLFLAVRDRTNTPLQILELSSHLIEVRCPAERETAIKMRNAVNDLKELSDILAETEKWREAYRKGESVEAEITKTFNRLR